ncbi:MAG: winged helix-turn-helix domain-containing protein [Nitrososphaera sp.]|jgi:predicted transcriptional regulator
MKYRSRMDIAAAILDVAQGGALKTKIMYTAFLSSPQLKEYLDLLTEQGLLEYASEDRAYATTEKGMRFLKMYKEVGQAVFPVNKAKESIRKQSVAANA